MSRILVIYGTTTGHTGKVARVLGDAFQASGHDVDVVEAAGAGRPFVTVLVVFMKMSAAGSSLQGKAS